MSKTSTKRKTMTKTSSFKENLQKATLKTCHLCDHDKDMTWLVNLCEIVDISDSSELEFMTIIVT